MRLQGTYLSRKVTSSNESVVTATATSSANKGTYTITVDQLASGAYVTSTAALGSGTDTSTLQKQFGLASAEDITLQINGVELTVNTGTDSMTTLVKKINELKDAGGNSVGVNASYDAATDRLYLTTAKTGSSAQIDIVQTSPDPSTDTNLLSLLKIDSYTFPATGKNAIFDLNGVSNLEQSSNEFTIAGVKYNLVGTSTSPVTLKVAYDTDGVYDTIKSFIDQYNATLDLMKNELTETRYKGYNPLTDEEREELSEKQQEQWEEKAKSGLLRNDSLLSSIVIKMRSSISGVVSGIQSVMVNGKKVTHNNLTAIGIATSADYTEGGKLHIAEEDLRKAIENDPEGIMNLFTQDGEGKEKGIARRLSDSLEWAVGTIIDKAGAASEYSSYDNSNMGKQLKNYDDQIDIWTDRLAKVEDRYWSQFTAMERAISSLNTQSQWLSQQFGNGS
jgi:flagellar hook-associated protein 2